MNCNVMEMFGMAVMLTLVTATGCDVASGTDAGNTAQRLTGIRYQIYCDISPSTNSAQRREWLRIVERDVLTGLTSGDQVEVYGLHDNTENSAPIYQGCIPAIDEGAGMKEVLEYRRALKDTQTQVTAAVRSLLEGDHPRSRSTAVLGAINRYQQLPARETNLVIFTDALESADPVANLEGSQMNVDQVPAAVRSVATRWRWDGSRLAGSRVFFVLNSIPIGATATGATDRKTLKAFWESLITALGGKVENFDTHFSKPLRRAETTN